VRVSVIIPTRNEARAIGRVLEDLPADLVTEVIVIDSNSTDGTPEIAGAKAPHPALFEGDGMGTKSALDALLARARTMKLSVGFTDPFFDIDVAADLMRLAAELRLTPARAPRTAVWLKEWAQTVAQLRTSTAQS
jgi:hypothetical protein